MNFTPSNPFDLFHTQLEKENFEKQQKQIDEYLKSVNKIKNIAENMSVQTKLAVKKSQKADVKGWIAIIISILTFALELSDRIGLF